MAVYRQQPYGNARFEVEIPSVSHTGFLIVQVPDLLVDQTGYREGDGKVLSSTPVAKRPAFSPLVLKRGFHGDLDLYNWWKEAADTPAGGARDLLVKLLSEDASGVVVTWRITGALPVRYGFAPLDAQDGGPLVEVIEAACRDVTMS